MYQFVLNSERLSILSIHTAWKWEILKCQQRVIIDATVLFTVSKAVLLLLVIVVSLAVLSVKVLDGLQLLLLAGM